MRYQIKLVAKPTFLNHKDINTDKLKTNLKHHPITLFCNFFNAPYTEVDHIETHIKCGDSILNGALQLNGFDTLELELCDINFKSLFIHSFRLSQGMEKYSEYLHALIKHIENTYEVKFPETINIVANSKLIFEIA